MNKLDKVKADRILKQFKQDRYATAKFLAYYFNATIEQVEALLDLPDHLTLSPETLKEINSR